MYVEGQRVGGLFPDTLKMFFSHCQSYWAVCNSLDFLVALTETSSISVCWVWVFFVVFWVFCSFFKRITVPDSPNHWSPAWASTCATSCWLLSPCTFRGTGATVPLPCARMSRSNYCGQTKTVWSMLLLNTQALFIFAEETKLLKDTVLTGS